MVIAVRRPEACFEQIHWSHRKAGVNHRRMKMYSNFGGRTSSNCLRQQLLGTHDLVLPPACEHIENYSVI